MVPPPVAAAPHIRRRRCTPRHAPARASVPTRPRRPPVARRTRTACPCATSCAPPPAGCVPRRPWRHRGARVRRGAAQSLKRDEAEGDGCAAWARGCVESRAVPSRRCGAHPMFEPTPRRQPSMHAAPPCNWCGQTKAAGAATAAATWKGRRLSSIPITHHGRVGCMPLAVCCERMRGPSGHGTSERAAEITSCASF
eukprot:362245-Chlamydomonas_euryale.AAC.6